MPPDDKNRIENLKQTLYSRNAPDVRSRRRLRITDNRPDVPENWADAGKEGSSLEEMLAEAEHTRHGMSLPLKFFLGSLVFCVIALGIGTYVFFRGANYISGNNIAIDVSGPVSVPGGTPVTFNITVTNKNSVTLKTADLVVHFPAGATDPADTTQSLEDVREVLGDLEPGASVTKTVQAVIFGEQNSQKQVTASVTYGIAGSNSVFTKESSYDVVVNASPITVAVSSLQEVISGQDLQIKVDVKSNSENVVKNVLLTASYPFGFKYKSASVAPISADNKIWSVGDIPPGGTRSITITGALTGEDTDVRAFHFTVGARSQSNANAIGTTFTETEQVVSIKKPFVSLVVGLNDDTNRGDYVGSFGRPITVNIKWSNNLPETLSNVIITAHLSGNAYDKNTVAAWSGFYRSLTDDVVWDQKTNPELASVTAGANGTVSFTVTPSQSQGSDGALANPMLSISVGASGDRTDSSNVPLSTGSVARTIRVMGDVSLSGRVVRSTSPFPNSGPIPPVAEQPTTYTIIWSAEPSINLVSNAAVTATLPTYVTWTGQVSPSTEDVSYDKNSGVVTWNIGTMNPPLAGNSARRDVQFQVSVTPSVSQVGTAPILVNQASFTGTDAWTGSTVQSSQGYLTTSFSTDPIYRVGMETVVSGK